MYKLNIQTTPSGLECVIKRRFFNRLWLVVHRQAVSSRKEAKAIYKAIAY